MREIKFRAWDGKRMFNCGLMFFDSGGKVSVTDIPNSLGYPEAYEPRSDLEVMQYTGLKDKNGVDIYEGDIYQRVYENRKHYPSQPKRIVEWVLNRFNIRYADNLEVIGNIYETPELLK